MIPIRGATPTTSASQSSARSRSSNGCCGELRLVELEPHAQRLRELARARAEHPLGLEAAALSHLLEAPPRLERADQDGRRVPLGLGHRVQQAVDAVGEIDVRVPRRPVERRRPLGQPDVGVAGRLGDVVRLGLGDDPADAVHRERAPDQVARDLHHRPVVELDAELGAQLRHSLARSASASRAAAICSATRADAVPPAETFDSSHASPASTS